MIRYSKSNSCFFYLSCDFWHSDFVSPAQFIFRFDHVLPLSQQNRNLKTDLQIQLYIMLVPFCCTLKETQFKPRIVLFKRPKECQSLLRMKSYQSISESLSKVCYLNHHLESYFYKKRFLYLSILQYFFSISCVCRRNMVSSLPRGMPKVVDYRQTGAQATNEMVTQDKHEVLSRFDRREGVIPTFYV